MGVSNGTKLSVFGITKFKRPRVGNGIYAMLKPLNLVPFMGVSVLLGETWMSQFSFVRVERGHGTDKGVYEQLCSVRGTLVVLLCKH